MPGNSTFVGSDDAALDDAAPDGVELGEAEGVAAGAAVAEADDAGAVVVGLVAADGVGPVDDGDVVRAGCVCAGTACGPRPAADPQADSATAAISATGSRKRDERRTRPSSQPVQASNHGPPVHPA